jgi:hypothetical protein
MCILRENDLMVTTVYPLVNCEDSYYAEVQLSLIFEWKNGDGADESSVLYLLLKLLQINYIFSGWGGGCVRL